MNPLSVLPPDLSAVLGAFQRLVKCIGPVVVILFGGGSRHLAHARCSPANGLTMGQIKHADQGRMFKERRDITVILRDAVRLPGLACGSVIGEVCCHR